MKERFVQPGTVFNKDVGKLWKIGGHRQGTGTRIDYIASKPASIFDSDEI
jgi:hypothetical protein